MQPCCHLPLVQRRGSKIGPIPHCSLGWVRLCGAGGVSFTPPKFLPHGTGYEGEPAASRTVSPQDRPRPYLLWQLPHPHPAPASVRRTPRPRGVGAAVLLPSEAENTGPQLGGGSDQLLAGTLPVHPKPARAPQTRLSPPPKGRFPQSLRGQGSSKGRQRNRDSNTALACVHTHTFTPSDSCPGVEGKRKVETPERK